MLQFVIPREKYSLCLVNPGKKDVQDVYLKYSGYTVKGTNYYDYDPTLLQADILYGESYAVLEEYNCHDLDTIFVYEVLFVSEDGIILKKFFRKKLENVAVLDKHPLFNSSIWEIEETTCEYINVEDIIQIVTMDIYASRVPKNNSTYRYLLERSDLFERFFEDLYLEMENFYRGENCNSILKFDFAQFMQSHYGLRFEESLSTDLILSNCAALMRKLHLSKVQMAEYYIEYLI